MPPEQPSQPQKEPDIHQYIQSYVKNSQSTPATVQTPPPQPIQDLTPPQPPPTPQQKGLFKRFLLNIEKMVVLISIIVGFVYLLNYFLVRLKVEIPFLNFGITFFILLYFWWKWRQTLLIILIGFLTFFFETIALAPFKINSTNFSTQIAASTIFFLLLPLFIILPFVGPVALVYAFFRGLLKSKSELQVQQATTYPSTNKTRARRIVVAVVGVILLFIIGGPIYYTFIYSGREEKTLKNDPNIGRIITLGVPGAYSQDNLAHFDGPKMQEINRFLECIGDIDSVGNHHYKDGYYNVGYLASSTELEIVEVIDTETKGLERIGGEGLTYFVLRDNNGTLYTEAQFTFDEFGPWCEGRLESHLEKLFLYIEKAGKARIELTLWRDDNTVWNSPAVSTSVGQDRLISDLNKIPSKYKVENIEKVDSYIPGMKAVAVDVDADTLVYLVASRLDLAVWEIRGLDEEYEDTLTNEDRADLHKKPIDWSKQATSTPQTSTVVQTTPVAYIPTTSPSPPPAPLKKYSNTQYHFEFMNPGLELSEVSDPDNRWYSWRKKNTSEYLSFIPYIKYNDYKPIPGDPITANEKIGGKNAIAKTWTSGGATFKRYYILDPIPGWTLCDQQLTNATKCGQIEYYSIPPSTEIQQMVSSIKFN